MHSVQVRDGIDVAVELSILGYHLSSELVTSFLVVASETTEVNVRIDAGVRLGMTSYWQTTEEHFRAAVSGEESGADDAGDADSVRALRALGGGRWQQMGDETAMMPPGTRSEAVEVGDTGLEPVTSRV